MIAKKTAVEWLVDELKESIGLKDLHAIERARQMEKQQIIDAYHINPLESKWKNIGEQYYNETFKSK